MGIGTDTLVDTLSFNECVQAVVAARRADVTIGIEGPPGVGKSALAALVARQLDERLYILIGSNAEPTDIGGLPVVLDAQLKRIPLPQIRACADEPALLFLDELTGVPRSVQQPLMRGLLEKVFGDIALHPGSYVFGAWNPPNQAAAAQHLSAATGSRIIQVRMMPKLDEVAAYFDGLGEPGSALRSEARDFSATLRVQTSLLMLQPPKTSLETGAPWASPRAWERGLRAYVAGGGQKDDRVCRALLAGAVGREQATAYLVIKDMRQHLPSLDEIVRDPDAARLSADPQHQIAAVGLLSRVAEKDAAAAWLYTARLRPELQLAVAAALVDRPEMPFSDRFGMRAYQTMEKMLAAISRRATRVGM